MILAITATEMEIRPQAPIVYRGSYADTLPAIARHGYQGVEAHIHDSADFDRERMRRLLKQSGLTLAAIGTGSAYGRDGLSLTHNDAAVRDAAAQRLEGHLQTAADHPGCVVIVGLIRGKVTECDGGYPVYEQRLLEGLARCARRAKEVGALLVLEMVNRYEADALNRVEEGLALLRTLGSAQVKLHLDTFHMNMEEADIPAAIAAAGDAVGHVHVADSDRRYPGHGHYPFEETVQALRGIGYTGALSVECLALPDAEQTARCAIQRLKPLL